MSLFISKILLGISLAAPVGPVSVEVIRRGLRRGFFAAFPVCIGAIVGDFLYLLMAYFGLAPFLMNSVIRITILFLGASMLLYLGVQCIKKSWKPIEIETSSGNDNKNAVILGFLLAVINPMSIVWWLSVFGAVLGSTLPEELTLVLLLSNLTIILGTLIWSLTLCLILHFGKRFVGQQQIRAISILAGSSLVGYGLYFGYTAITTLCGTNVV
ncbi:LysE family transporter [Simkania negevensis]|uniref:LysE family transporter n=1 Tax=Simkania negevensis TaxID=83561 RepID=A0ABS3ARQ3_9BACT|nr:LysE family transporter [Simkania negevensis]